MRALDQPPGSVAKNSKGEIVVRFNDGSGWRCGHGKPELGYRPPQWGWHWDPAHNRIAHPSTDTTIEILCGPTPEDTLVSIASESSAEGERRARALAVSASTVAMHEVGDWIPWMQVPVGYLVRVRFKPDRFRHDTYHGAVAYRGEGKHASGWVYRGHRGKWTWAVLSDASIDPVLIVAKCATWPTSEFVRCALASELVDDRWTAETLDTTPAT